MSRSPSPHARLVWLAAAASLACTDLPTGPAGAPSLAGPSRAISPTLSAFTGDIRIGVVPASAAVRVGATGDFVVRDRATGVTLLAGSGIPATVTLETSAVTYLRLQGTCASEAGRDARMAAANARGIPTFTEFVMTSFGGCWRVYLGEFPLNASFTLRNNFRLEMIAVGLADADAFYRQITFGGGDDRYTVTLGTAKAITLNPVAVEVTSGMVTIADSVYRGRAEVQRNGGSSLAGINILPIEQYLYGVVPRELPPNVYREFEAQKAQAVGARTYALANLGKQRVNGYDLLPTTADQVYGGYSAEHPVSTAAVDATAGVVATYDGVPFTTFYHSTSGGWTANSEHVYRDTLAYLRGVPDAERGQALEHVPSLEAFKRNANPTNLRASAEGDFESDWSRYHRWVVEWSTQEMAAILAMTFEKPVSEVYAITVTDRTEHGRAQRVVFSTDAGELVALKDDIRPRLRYLDASNTAQWLRSTMFYLEEVRDPRTKAITGWKAFGGGWGHGVGMSQTGAVGMAERGYDFVRILKHYYQGIELVRWY